MSSARASNSTTFGLCCCWAPVDGLFVIWPARYILAGIRKIAYHFVKDNGMHATHPALVISAPGQLHIAHMPTQHPQAGEILVAPLRASICGSDLDVLRESARRYFFVSPSPFAIGQRVTFVPNDHLRPHHFLAVSTRGLLQRSLVISQAALACGMAVACDANLPLTPGPLLEPFATVIYGQRLMERVCQAQRMVVIGDPLTSCTPGHVAALRSFCLILHWPE
jgi:hypothetical protein